MGDLTGVPYPIFLFIAVKFMALNNGFVSCGADSIGYFAKLQPITDTIAELFTVHKGNTIDNKMVVGPLLSRVVFVLSYLSHPSRSFTVLFLSGALHFAMKSFSESSMLFLSSGSAK